MSGRNGLAVGLNLGFMTGQDGGVGRYVQELLPALLEFDPGLHIAAFVGHRAPRELFTAPWSDEVEWVRLPARTDRGTWAAAAQMAAVPILARRRGLDVIHGPANIGAPPTPGISRVVSLHDLIWLHYAKEWEASRRARLTARYVFTASARSADRVITVSEAARDDLVATLGLDAAKIDVTPHGVRSPSPETPSTPAQELRSRFELGDAPFVLSVAQKRPYKKLDALIRAMPELSNPHAMLVLPGAPTEHEGDLRALATQLGVAGRVRFPPWVSEADLEGLYREAHCFALPSLIEGFGLPALEAMARGLPVACSDRGALPEVVGDAALLFDSEDQGAVTGGVNRLLEDRELAAELARRGEDRSRLFTWARTAEATVDCYRRATYERSNTERPAAVRGRHTRPPTGTRRLRVGLVARDIDQPNGLGVYASNLLAQLAADTQHDITLYSTRTPTSPTGQGRIVQRISRLGGLGPRPLRVLWESILVPAAARRDGVNVLHYLYPGGPLVPLDRAVITTVFDAIPWALGGDYGLPRWEAALSRRSADVANIVLTGSASAAADIQDFLGVPAKKIRSVALAGPPVERRSTDRERVTEDDPFWLFVGGTQQRKNLEVALRAFALTRPERIRLKVVGPAPDQSAPRFASRVELLRSVPDSVGEQVDWLGSIEQDALDALYRDALALLAPTLYEGFGLPVLEAMARGTPVIASNASSIPEVAGDAAILLDPSNPTAWCEAMSTLEGNQALRAQLSARGMQTAGSFSWAETARKTLAIYAAAGETERCPARRGRQDPGGN